VAASITQQTYEPRLGQPWEEAQARLRRLAAKSS
jgi:hypothetical protein